MVGCPTKKATAVWSSVHAQTTDIRISDPVFDAFPSMPEASVSIKDGTAEEVQMLSGNPPDHIKRRLRNPIPRKRSIWGHEVHGTTLNTQLPGIRQGFSHHIKADHWDPNRRPYFLRTRASRRIGALCGHSKMSVHGGVQQLQQRYGS